MNTVYILKEYDNPNCNTSRILKIYEDYNDAIKERDRLRALTKARAASLEYGVYSPRLLIDVVAYDLTAKEAGKKKKK